MKLIDKDAVVAEIEKLRKNAWKSFQKGNSTEEQYYLRYGVIQDTLYLINNLEVKEVNLDKEIDNIWNPRFNLGWDEKSLLSVNHKGFTTIAKHFFELGVKAQKGGEV